MNLGRGKMKIFTLTPKLCRKWRLLTIIVFDKAGLETFQFIARDDCLGLNIYITLKSP